MKAQIETKVKVMKDNTQNINTSVIRERLENLWDISYYEKCPQDTASALMSHMSAIVDDPLESETVLQHLFDMQNLLDNEIPLEFRPRLFQKMNRLTDVLKEHFLYSEDIFSKQFEIMSRFQDIINKAPQEDEALAHLEWEALETCVYSICAWEDLFSNHFNNTAA